MESKLNNMKKKVGRPKIPDDQKKTYQRIAIYPESYQKIKLKTKPFTDLEIKDYIKNLVDNDSN